MSLHTEQEHDDAATTLCQSQSMSHAEPTDLLNAGWMTTEELTEAWIEISLQPPRDETELKTRTNKWLREEIAFISNPMFAMSGAGDEVFSEPLDLNRGEQADSLSSLRSAGVEMPIHLARMCEAPLLKPEQERLLFQRMNFLLHQANVLRSTLDCENLSAEKVNRLEQLVALAHWHRDRIVEANVRLVVSIVKKFVNQHNTFDDLLSDGVIGLMRAVEKFDYDRGFRFSTYATQVLRRNAYRLVVTKQQDRQKVIGGLQELDVDIAEGERSSAIGEKRWHLLRRRLSGMLDELDRREKLIVRSRFALVSHRRVRTLQALADRLGISKERVRQLERRALEKLQAMAQENPLSDFELAVTE